MTLKDAPEYEDMAAIIKRRLAGRSAAYFTNPGNLGDALIEAGSLAFLKQNGISYRLKNSRHLRDLHARHYKLAYAKGLSLRVLSAGLHRKYPLTLRDVSKEHDVAIVCGSGGFANQARVAMQIVALCAEWFSDVIVLPTTYSLAPQLPKHVLFFARDRYESLETVPTATFCHDMAFYLEPPAIAPQRRVGYHIRTDVESSGRLPLPRKNLDISAEGTELDPIDRLFGEVGKSEQIVTDRLHVCIAATLLRRRVYLFRGNYFKIEAIYKSSLQPYFSNVSLLDDWRQLPAEVRQ
jgi:exopolysaccharide biosynthesis predicted pyruvyltransferase EpsI